jgi:hypothetical protein
VDSSAITKALGKKKNIAAKIHKVMDDCPACAARAIHLGPRTAAMLKSTTSIRPISLRRRAVPVVAGFSVVAIFEERLTEQVVDAFAI